MTVTRVGKLTRASLALLISGGALVAFACSGEPFCGDTRTCPTASDAAGQAGESSSHGDSGSSGEGGANGGSDNTSLAGAGGESTSTVGMPCAKDAECDDKDSCNGSEQCVDGKCAAGEAVKCPAGLVCSAAKQNACVFPSKAPWIVYAAEADTAGVTEAYGIKSDLLGTMTPVKLSAKLASGWQVTAISNWSPDGSAAIITTSNAQLKLVDSYLVRFADEPPKAPLFLTEGMSASSQSSVKWSSSGKTLMIRRDDGIHALEVADDGKITQALASGSNYAVSDAWIKNDDELLFYGKNILSTKFGFYVAARGPSSWSQKLIAEVAGAVGAGPTPDGGLLAYLVIDAQNSLQSLWAVESAAGSTPHKVAGPANTILFSPSSDTSQLLVASTNNSTGQTSITGGPLAQLLALPSVKAGLLLPANDVLPLYPATPWALDSSRAWAFQDSAVGKQLVVYQANESGGAKWHPLALHQLTTDPHPIWSPDSKVLALPTKTAVDSAMSLTLVTSPDYVSKDVDQTVNGGYFSVFGFSAGTEFFAYAKGTGGAYTNGFYLDLRAGVAKAPKPVPIDDPIDSLRFGSSGTAALYARAGKEDCNFIDFGAAVPDAVSPVNDGKPVATCGFQQLPK